MTELKRWLETDGAPPEVLALLRSARPARPLDERARQRSRRRISLLTAVPAAAGTFVWLQHAAYGAVLGAAVAGAAAVAPQAFSRQSPQGVSTPTPTAPQARSARAITPVAPTPSTPLAPTPEQPPPRPTPAARFEPGEHELSREARSLEHARALVSSRPAQALVALGRHRVEFPRGALEIECEFLEVEAYVRLGRRAEAEASARVLRERAPGSLYEGRLQRLMATDPSP